MAKKKQTSDVVQAEQPRGWIPKERRTRRINLAGDNWEPADGAEPLWVEVVADLSFDDCDAIPWNSGTYSELFTVIAPLVTGWNVCGRDLITGAWEPIPAPADAGPDVFRAIPKSLTSQIVLELKFGPLPQGDQKKELTATDDTDGG